MVLEEVKLGLSFDSYNILEEESGLNARDEQIEISSHGYRVMKKNLTDG